jgi:hypothetical protein
MKKENSKQGEILKAVKLYDINKQIKTGGSETDDFPGEHLSLEYHEGYGHYDQSLV